MQACHVDVMALRDSDDDRNRRMPLKQTRLVTGLLAALLWVFSSAAADETIRRLSVESEIPQRGDYMCVGFGSLWMMSGQKLMRIALADTTATEIPIEGATGRWRRITVGEGAIWVADNLGQAIYKIDPNSNLVVMTIPIDFPIDNESAAEIGVGAGGVWAITGNGHDQVLRRLSAVTGAEQATIPLPSPSADRGIVVDFDSVWVAGTRDVELYRIDPATNRIATTLELHARPIAIASGEGSVWVRELGGTVERIDGNSGKLLATIATDAIDRFGELVVGGGFVWINSDKAPLLQIDPRTNAQRSRLDSPNGKFMSYSIAYGGGSLWLGGSAVFRIKPPD